MTKLDLKKVNHFVLQKQHLAEDSKIDNIVQIVKDVFGLHATSATTPYLSLLARTRSFTKDDLDQELYEKRNLGKIRCVRKTVYVLPKEMIPVAYSATQKMVQVNTERFVKYVGVTQKEYQETSKSVLKILKDRGMTAKEVKQALQTELNISAILNLMCDLGLLVRGAPPKGWKSSIHTYYPFHKYFPDINLNQVDEAKARELLIKQYLASFGPITENDVAWWTGFPKRDVRQILKSLQDQITQAEISNLEGNYVMLSSDERFLKSLQRSKKQAVNLLPSLDPYLMGYKERQRYLNHRYYDYDKIFDRSGNATSTISLDGRIAGVWDFTEDTEPMVKLLLFEKVQESSLRNIYKEARRTGKFIAGKEVRVKECDSMVPLTQRTAGGFMSPLKSS